MKAAAAQVLTQKCSALFAHKHKRMKRNTFPVCTTLLVTFIVMSSQKFPRTWKDLNNLNINKQQAYILYKHGTRRNLRDPG